MRSLLTALLLAATLIGLAIGSVEADAHDLSVSKQMSSVQPQPVGYSSFLR